MKYVFYFSLIFFFLINNSFSCELEQVRDPSVQYVVITGQDGYGGTNLEESGIIHPYSSAHQTFINTHNLIDDFGQKHCQDCLKSHIDPIFFNEDIKKIVFHASSQGTASLLIYLANLVELDKVREEGKWGNKIGALILEAPMVSGNSAVYHFVSNHFKFGHIPFGALCHRLPYSYHWM
ncbi:MAG: hypothetical protein V4482_04200 [Pseudomonadota bacterium]